MKTYLYIIAILPISYSLCEFTPEFEKQVDECIKEFELTEDEFKSPDFENPKIKCFTACLLKKGDRLTEGKLISADKEIELAAIYMPGKVDDSLKEKFTDCVNTANEEKDDCQLAGAFYKCLFTKYGLWKVEE